MAELLNTSTLLDSAKSLAASSQAGSLFSSPLTDFSNLAEGATVKAMGLFGTTVTPSAPAADSGLAAMAKSSAGALDGALTGFKFGGFALAVIVGLVLLHEAKEAVSI